MHRDFRTPQDVSNASPDRVGRSLGRLLRQGFESRPFLYRVQFRYEGGGTAPLLYIGTLNRAWEDYITGHARANDMAVGTCRLGRDDTGRTQIRVQVTRGQGKRDACLAALNRVLRYINAELVFADSDQAPAGAPQATPAEDAPAETRAAGDTVESTRVSALDLKSELQGIRDGFEAFKGAPTREALDGLNARIAAWQRAVEGQPALEASKGARSVEQLRALLAQKGDAFVAKANA